MVLTVWFTTLAQNLLQRLSGNSTFAEAMQTMQKATTDNLQIQLEKSKPRGVDALTVLLILLVMSAGISLAIIQTYIKKEIYYESREISKIQKEYNILKEEEVALKNSINQLRYENLVVDMITDINDTQE
jgi:cell division protein FtsB